MNASDYRQIARNNLAGNWVTSVLVALVASLLGGLIFGANFSISIDQNTLAQYLTEDGFALLWPTIVMLSSAGSTIAFAQFVLGGVIALGYCTYLLQQYDRSGPLEFKTLFSRFDLFSKGFFLSLLQTIYIILWSLLFIIPGVVKSFSYAMSSFIMAENPHMTPKEAITASRQLMDGHKGELFCLYLSFLGWIILSVFTLGIGFLFLNPYMNAACAAFYRKISGGNSYTAPAAEM